MTKPVYLESISQAERLGVTPSMPVLLNRIIDADALKQGKLVVLAYVEGKTHKKNNTFADQAKNLYLIETEETEFKIWAKNLNLVKRLLRHDYIKGTGFTIYRIVYTFKGDFNV